MKYLMLLALLLASGVPALAQQASRCIPYTVVTEDILKNVKEGLPPKDAAWAHGKLAKRYPAVCYVDPGPQPTKVVLYLSITPDTYHGTKTVANVSTSSQVNSIQTQTTTSYEDVPYSVDYGIYTLLVERLQDDGTFVTTQTFQQKGLYTVMYGIPLGGRGHHPAHAVIEDAVKWISDGGLSDPTQGSNLPQQLHNQVPASSFPQSSTK